MTENKFSYTYEIPIAEDLFELYNHDGWNAFLKLSKEVLHQAMTQSWCVLSVYDDDQLIGTGRIISDGLINAYLCGVIVHPDYRSQGIGKEMVQTSAENAVQRNYIFNCYAKKKRLLIMKSLVLKCLRLG